jgi:O-methyltransferase
MRNLREVAKWIVYRAPVASRLMAPSYPYKLNPAQLAAMIELIDVTRESGASIAEIGVAKGDTSVFLLEHLSTTGDERPLHLFDTFGGFTEESVAVEVSARGKAPAEYGAFRYGDETRFRRSLESAGYESFRIVKGDASRFDWSTIAPIGAVLLDIDLYQPTISTLEAVWPHLVPSGGVVVDDCTPGTPWDGSLQAYEEFIAAHGLPFERVGHKGAVVRKPPA